MYCRKNQLGLCLVALGVGMLASLLLGTCLSVIAAVLAMILGLLIMKGH